MADTPASTPPLQPTRPSKPASEALLNDKVTPPSLSHIPYPKKKRQPKLTPSPPKQWDHALSSLLVRSTLGLSFGVIFSVLLFKRRAWPAFVGLGFGAGRAWEEADGMCFPHFPPFSLALLVVDWRKI